MATLTTAAKAAEVNIVRAVAAVTTALAFYFFRRFGMACIAGQPLMLSVQCEVGLSVVIKLPQCPVVRRMAAGAVRSQCAFVLIVIFMAADTLQ